MGLQVFLYIFMTYIIEATFGVRKVSLHDIQKTDPLRFRLCARKSRKQAKAQKPQECDIDVHLLVCCDVAAPCTDITCAWAVEFL